MVVRSLPFQLLHLTPQLLLQPLLRTQRQLPHEIVAVEIRDSFVDEEGMELLDEGLDIRVMAVWVK